MKRRAVARKRPRRPVERVGMGRLILLKIELPDGRKRTWNFRERPVLSFDYVARDASGKGRRARLFVDCGDYRVTADNKLTTKATEPAASTHRVRASIVDKYRRTHGGRAATETVRCPVRPQGKARFVGYVTQMDYRADKGHGGRVHYYHPISDDAQPEVWVSASGRSVYFRRGRLTVTPHGIEDCE